MNRLMLVRRGGGNERFSSERAMWMLAVEQFLEKYKHAYIPHVVLVASLLLSSRCPGDGRVDGYRYL